MSRIKERVYFPFTLKINYDIPSKETHDVCLYERFVK